MNIDTQIILAICLLLSLAAAIIVREILTTKEINSYKREIQERKNRESEYRANWVRAEDEAWKWQCHAKDLQYKLDKLKKEEATDEG